MPPSPRPSSSEVPWGAVLKGSPWGAVLKGSPWGAVLKGMAGPFIPSTGPKGPAIPRGAARRAMGVAMGVYRAAGVGGGT
jgi:hypothetical protein